jgi:DNA adenine methylase
VILRYPGGKGKVAKTIVDILKSRLGAGDAPTEYREPFFGGGAVGLRVIKECPELSRYWINDRDPAMACVWRAVVQRPESLRVILGCLEPSVAYFGFYKRLLKGINLTENLGDYDSVAVAAMKVACHAMSFSGLGTMSGPIGGASQTGAYDVGCRYDAERIARNVYEARDLLGSVTLHPEVCTCLDFEEVIVAGGDAVYYIDPPYYKAGPALYQAAFSHEDHIRLAELLRHEDRPWLLSYDTHPAIADLYGGWASVREIPISYSIHGAVKSAEWLISNFEFDGTLPAA